MQKIGIFFGSDAGTTEEIAEKMQQEFGEDNAEVFDVADADGSDMESFTNLIFGASTQGIGDMQGDFEEFMEEIEEADLSGKTVAIFGLGDADTYADTFVDAIGIIHELLDGKDCKIIGSVPTDGYEYDESIAEIDGVFVGLPIDEDNQDDLTDERIKNWVAQLKSEFN